MSSPLALLYNDLNSVFKQTASPWYVIDAQAAIIHGAARLTADVDITLMYGNRELDDLLKALKGNGFNITIENPAEFIERTRVLPVIHSSTEIPVDIIFGGPGLEEIFLERIHQYDLDGINVPIASSEDIIAMKILSGRTKDLEDALSITKANKEKLDLQHIRTILNSLEQALDRSDLESVLDNLLKQT